jgi:hypothetical protein
MEFANQLLERINYNTKLASAQIGFQNLKNLSPSLTEDNIYSLAIMANNTAISEEEREVFKKCLELKCKNEIQQFELFRENYLKKNIDNIYNEP